MCVRVCACIHGRAVCTCANGLACASVGACMHVCMLLDCVCERCSHTTSCVVHAVMSCWRTTTSCTVLPYLFVTSSLTVASDVSFYCICAENHKVLRCRRWGTYCTSIVSLPLSSHVDTWQHVSVQYRCYDDHVLTSRPSLLSSLSPLLSP